jgi:hypothetical protein
MQAKNTIPPFIGPTGRGVATEFMLGLVHLHPHSHGVRVYPDPYQKLVSLIACPCLGLSLCLQFRG